MGGGCLFREGVMGALFEGRCVLFFFDEGVLVFFKGLFLSEEWLVLFDKGALCQ